MVRVVVIETNLAPETKFKRKGKWGEEFIIVRQRTIKMGILEEINGKLDRVLAALATGTAAPAAAQAAAQALATAPQTFATAPAGGFVAPAGGFTVTAAPEPAPAPVASAIDNNAIMALIQPYLDNEPVKAQFRAHHQAMGLAQLNDAQPQHFPELYARFQQVIQQFGGQAAPANTSLV